MSGPIAVLGAGGFVGARMIETQALSGRSDVVPVVRSFRSIARSSHLGIPHRIADAARTDAVRRAIAGCDAVVNLTTGPSGSIPGTTRAIHAACVAEGVRLLVHLSSAVVYGRVERPDIPDDAPPERRHWMAYARDKGEAERFLRSTLGGPVAVVVLRPGLIWGPGSPWVVGPVAALTEGRAYLIGDGGGVCNLVYVDNLVRSIHAVIARRPAAPGFYHVGDDGLTTWREYYGALARGLGLDAGTLPRVDLARYRVRWADRLDALLETRIYARLKERLSDETRKRVKSWLRWLSRADLRAAAAAPAPPSVARDMWMLQTTRYPLPTRKFRDTFGHQNLDSFAVAMERTVRWLSFVGFGAPWPADAEARERIAADSAEVHAGGR